tara:strand:- start:11518 stop:12450 length:933 start_codon:yes stop_codon:yes gene_type:complete
MSTRLGYACINTTLQQQKPKITCNRGMIKRTFKTKGLDYASELSLYNTSNILPILKWNEANGIKVFRITSCLFPWGSEYELEQLKDFESICKHLTAVGQYALENNHRLSFHPGPFNILSSPKPHVVENSFKDLEMHGKIFDLMGMPRSPQSKINIHVGASYGERETALARFCKNFEKLSESVRSRLTVENDDKGNLYSTKMLYHGVFEEIGIPIVFDSHHFECGPQDTDYEEAFLLANDTWPEGIRQQCHHSNSKALYEDEKVMINAHSDWYYEPFNDCGFDVDVVLECKKKELALLKYRKDFLGDDGNR